MFEDKTPESIHEALLNAISDEIDKREGSVAYDLTYPPAIEIGNVYTAMEAVIELAFAETAYGEYLDMWSAPFGVERKLALTAGGFVTLTGPPGTVVPAGTRLQTASDMFFATSEEVTIADVPVRVSAVAEVGGSAGNVALNEITSLAPGDLYGIVGVVSSETFIGGVDEEDDEALRGRLLERARRPSTSGNAQHYKDWALSVQGVGDASVFPLHAGPGTVKVVVVNDDKQPPTPDIVARADDFIQENKPIGATVTVAGAAAFEVNITADVTLTPGADLVLVTAAFKSTVNEYLRVIAFNGEAVRYAKIGQALIATEGVLDYGGLEVNGGTVNVTPAADQIAITGTVTLND